MSSISAYSGVTQTSNKTANGTKIVSSANAGALDKNQFLKILCAELTNQDPTNSQDSSTEYVSQMAQMTSLEQMGNLNSTMQLMAASSLIGSTVTTNTYDKNGNLISGIVQNVIKSGDDIKLNVLVGDNDVQEFNMSDVTKITKE